MKVNLEECERRVKEFKKKNCGDVIMAASEREKRVQELDKMVLKLFHLFIFVFEKFIRCSLHALCAQPMHDKIITC